MNSEKISSIVLAVLVAIAAIVCVLFCVGGSQEEIYSGEAFDAPNFTGAVLNVVYIFLCLAIVATVVSAILSFFVKLKNDKRSAYTSLAMIVALTLLCGITYAIGDGTPLNMPNYDGKENTEGYLKLADMSLYSIYTLFVLAAIAALFNVTLAKSINKIK
ncbi:MAG: hypothetical protein IKV67_01630 [Paludibacteraceae bacterium]|jgi:hypothetical protein|nr:hypothetical protein [Paludibacteraceae bacterium]